MPRTVKASKLFTNELVFCGKQGAFKLMGVTEQSQLQFLH